MADGTSPKQILSYLIILGISLIFVLEWGPGSRGCEVPWKAKQTTAAASVNGHEISVRDFNEQYRNQLQAMSARGQAIPESLARQFGFPKQVLDMMVNTELLAQAAEQHGIEASDRELQELIQRQPAFQKDGHFDYERYQEVLRDFEHKTDVEYEADLRHQLAAQKMLDLVESSALISDDEVKARFLKEGNNAKVTYVRFLPAMFADKVPAPSAAEIDAYKKDHAKEIQAYYDANRSVLYHQPERVHLRQILIKVPPDATADQKAAAKQKIDNVRKQIEGGKSFAEMAKDVSEDLGSKQNGGDLGFNDRSALAPEVATVAFSLKPGELSQPIESHYGYHLIKVEELKPAEEKQLKDVENEVAKTLFIKAKSKDLAKAEAEKALAEAKAGKKLDALYPPDTKSESASPMTFEIESKPHAVDAGEITASSDSLPKLGPAPQVLREIFNRPQPGPLDKVYPIGEGLLVVDVTSRTIPSDADFAAKKDELHEEAIQAKKIELRESFLRSLKKSANVITNDKLISADQSEGGES